MEEQSNRTYEDLTPPSVSLCTGEEGVTSEELVINFSGIIMRFPHIESGG